MSNLTANVKGIWVELPSQHRSHIAFIVKPLDPTGARIRTTRGKYPFVLVVTFIQRGERASTSGLGRTSTQQKSSRQQKRIFFIPF